ncbi:MAG: hypothetical protein ACRDLA_02420, partial [Thermoleophilaceae bacterium]
MSASKLPGAALQRTYLDHYDKAKKRGSDPGRNILLKGVETGDGRVRAAKKAELRRSIGVLRRMTAAPAAAGAVPTAVGAVSPQLEAIAACESGGDPTAVNPAGYYGKYQ